MTDTSIFSSHAHWIWDSSDRYGYNYYLRALRKFQLKKTGSSSLKITADALYQVWINGQVVGHGPAKSAEGFRSVDTYDVSAFLTEGENVLEVLVLSIGVGTMTYCLDEAGLIFELQLPGQTVFSDRSTLVQREPRRLHRTVRRWILPCIEDVDDAASSSKWVPATVVDKKVALYPRRVPLPSREPLYPQRIVEEEKVSLPNFNVSYQLKPALVGGEERFRHNIFNVPAKLTLEIDSPVAQELQFTPALGSVTWSFQGKVVFEGNGWQLWKPEKFPAKIRLKKGTNILTGETTHNHFEDITLAGFVSSPVKVGHLRVEKDGKATDLEPQIHANAHALFVGSRIDKKGRVTRRIYDLGKVYNGWLRFDVSGAKGSHVMLSFFEALHEGPPLRIQFPDGSNNALTYHLGGKEGHFESFHPYGIRYIAVHTFENEPINLTNLHILTANCGSMRQGYLQSSDLMTNEIYKISSQTLISAVDDTFTDCPTFEQVDWNFDNRISWFSEVNVCANLPVVRNSIAVFAEDPGFKGLVRSQYPSAWDNFIPLWSFNWIMWCWDYYWYTGDVAFVRKMFPRVSAGIKEALGKINSKGLLEWPGVWHFVEWGKGRDDEHAVNSSEQATLVATLEYAEKLASLLGKPVPAWTSARKKLISAINRYLWNPKRNAYVDSLHEDGSQSPISTQATNAMMAIYGVASPQRSEMLARRILKKDPALIPFGSPYGLYYILELLDQQEKVDEIFEIVRERWGDMVKEGDGTTWEHFAEFGHGNWPTRSRCHPFSSYVLKYLVKYLLGVRITAPGYESVSVNIKAPRDIFECKGAIPTPKGLIRISWKGHGKNRKVNVEIPDGIGLKKPRI